MKTVYRKMYYELLDSVTDALEIIQQEPQIAKLKLEAAQLQCRQIYLNADPKLRHEKKRERKKYGSLVSFF